MVERVEQGAFTGVLDSRQDVVALFNHDMNMVLGRVSAGTLELRQDDIGLWYRISPPDTDVGRHVVTAIKRGDVPDSSFGFIPGEIKQVREGFDDVRLIKTVDRLQDVGPVTIGAYAGTSTEARGINQACNQRRLRAKLRG